MDKKFLMLLLLFVFGVPLILFLLSLWLGFNIGELMKGLISLHKNTPI